MKERLCSWCFAPAVDESSCFCCVTCLCANLLMLGELKEARALAKRFNIDWRDVVSQREKPAAFCKSGCGRRSEFRGLFCDECRDPRQLTIPFGFLGGWAQS